MGDKFKVFVTGVNQFKLALSIMLALSVIVSIIGISRITINSDMDIFAAKDSPYMAAIEKQAKVFDQSQLTVLLVFDTNQPGIAEMAKGISVIQKASELDVFNTKSLPVIEPSKMMKLSQSGLGIDQLISQLSSLGDLSPLTIKDDKSYFRVDLPLVAKLTLDDLHVLEEHLDTLGVTYHIAGDDFMQIKLFDYVLQILKFLPPLAIGSIFLVFSWQMGSIKTTFLSVLPAIIASIWTMGIVGASGQGVSIITVLAPIFTLIIGSADGLHFVSHYQEAFEKLKNKQEALRETLDMVGLPMIITTLTSMIGFLSLMFIGEPLINTLVIVASVGIFLAAVATWWALPLIFLSGLKLKPIKHRNEKLMDALKRVWGKPISLGVLLLCVLTMLVLPLMNTEFNQLMFYKEHTELYQSFETISATTGGGVPMMVTYSWRDQEDPVAISGQIEAAMLQVDGVTKVMGAESTQDLLASVVQDAPQVADLFLGGQDPLDRLINQENRIGRVIVFPSAINDDLLEEIEAAAKWVKQGHNIEIAGFQYVMKDLNDKVLSNQVATQALALLLVFTLMWLSLRKFKPALISLVPMTITMYLVYGYLAITQIPLNVFTVLMFSISIGVGIDYAIHFASVWMKYKERGMTTDQAMNLAFNYTSRPIIANAVGLAIGMTALSLSPLKIHVYLSMVMWFTMIVGSLLTLTLLPTLLGKLKKI